MSTRSTLAFVSFALVCSSSALAQQELVRLKGAFPGDLFGSAIAFVGDVDGDARDDFAVGAPYAYTSNGAAGAVTVYSGRTTAALATWAGLTTDDRFGTALASAGDIDGDNRADVIVGAPRGLPFLGFASGGYVQIRSGATGLVLRTIAAPVGPEGFGAAVAGGHDLDGDTVPDVLIGAPGGPGSDGAAYLHSGATGALLRSHTPSTSQASSNNRKTLGYAVTFAGDVDGDGRAEYALGAPGVIGKEKSYVQLFDGATGASVWRTTIDNDYEEFGWSLAPLDDITGDGVVDLAAGARQQGSFSGLGFGRVRLLDGASGAILASYGQGPGAEPGVALGWAVTAVGDLDGDGRTEIAGGASGADPHPWSLAPARATRIWSPASQAPLALVPAVDANDAFGFALASGDVNGDGLRDLLIGEPYADDNGDASGAVHVYSLVRAPVGYCAARVNSQGCTPLVTSTGAPSASSAQPFVITASQLINQSSGLLFYGYAPNATAHLGGTLCVRQPVRRTGVQSSGGSSSGVDCSGALAFDFNAWIASGADASLAAGAEVYAQFWSRDAQAASTTNLSGAIAFKIAP